MQLQVAMDFNFTVQKAVSLLENIIESVDIIEIGTPFVMECGLEPVSLIKKRFPDKKILADLKIADAGSYEAMCAFKMGADIVTVLATSDDLTVKNAIQAAREVGGKIMVDMLAIKNLPERLKQIDNLGADYICLHTSKDLQKLDQDPAAAFQKLRGYVMKSKLALAGGIKRENVAAYAEIRPDILIVGEGISAANDPGAAAAFLKRVMNEKAVGEV